MGHKISDGKAIDIQAPAAQVMNKGDLYRVNGWTGIAMNTVLAADTDRGLALEVSSEHFWKVKLPAAVTPAVGDLLYWTAGAGFKKGDTDLTATITGTAVAKVLETKNANGYATVRVLNNAPAS
jgi:Uncharacterized conserved protein (DUF2190)